MRTACLRAASTASRLTRSTCVAQLSRPQLAGTSSRVSSYLTQQALQKRAFQQNSTTAQQAAAAAAPADDVFDTPPQQTNSAKPFEALDTFPRRHIGPSAESAEAMLKALDPPVGSLDQFVRQVIPADILSARELKIGSLVDQSPESWKYNGVPESVFLNNAKEIMNENMPGNSLIGQGYYGTKVPEVIKRNVLENPAWYTSYTPYQPEISQGRLESLLNFQTMVSDLTGLSIANASVLDEPTAAAEAMTMSMGMMPLSKQKSKNKTFLVSEKCHPQTLAVLYSRAEGFGINIEVADVLANNSKRVEEIGQDLVGVLAQYPDTEGGVSDFRGLAEKVHKTGALFSVATDLLALTLLTPPGEFGADIAFGNAQRFGVPLGFGGPHAAFFACDEQYKRKIPGRLIGLSKDRLGNPAARLALQTREQHIRREKATSNICTAQALLANMSAMYAVYHGPNGLTAIAKQVVAKARLIQQALINYGFETGQRGKLDNSPVLFDTFVVKTGDKTDGIIAHLDAKHILVRKVDDQHIGISVDETTSVQTISGLLASFRRSGSSENTTSFNEAVDIEVPAPFKRTSEFMTHPVFNSHHSETELLRYINHLSSKDLSLVHSMIPLGSCTMKLNSTAEMAPVSFEKVSNLHPFLPLDRAKGYLTMIKQLEDDLADITGFHSVSLQPNSGAQGEFTGLRVIRKYLEQQPGKKRDICLIPVSAHGTNPASAAMCGMRVVPIKCDQATGNLDMADLKAKCEKHSEELGAFMVTYPSTFGVFEPNVKAACDLIHQHGGQVYMDGANMNAQIGLCSPGEIGADVCHLNLHKTFCIPHGGGGPGVGPIGVKEHLTPFLPGHLRGETGGEQAIHPVSGAPWGSASILPISWAYIKMMGAVGLTEATKITLLNANYILSRLKPHYPILYTNEKGRCAHEFILDVRGFKETAGIEAIDIAKRLQDYGFHAPTMSWPVANTLMIEPTESESKAELDQFCDALIAIRKEIQEVEDGKQPKDANVLKMSPHTQQDLITGEWNRSYTREKAAYPLSYLKAKKFWPSVARLDDAYGDTNLFCTCAPVQEEETDITGAAAPNPT
ncbi:GcvP Glycine cleavage system protein P pyridoxal-binding C-terminal domain [Pyrenophora tritici-repentis]|uniref:Glycine cleavage system P protein n=2 Tax=Pyrenophora tritici-repentis TaxID=45151 RepID=A0A2W1D6K9_9PLEO|nr:glycine dehydrogenase [Pyrenophora tritici-repentis Pt-1C-BFP]KAA8615556.1 Glycine dehydrogenase [Pyrenophora tritici-repentis]EDU51413.1 glycine dehydrogenase [Pyrenophora tritici-repentis Pt-1C-BFP]KAF7443863.1 Glycine dehydrogenase [Pyrenophora tritici-repentis]KAF7566410.1 GcvP, Glycine cleavage system protein P (pyridoxal-binding), C-terminal domain protein [Pyrenophora tritici-repentis]KAG9379602.1 Glycine dehydrogenase [Pyrenophora tritici-repentis]